MRNLSQIMLISGCILTVAAVVLGALGQHTAFGPVVIAMFAAFGLHLQTKPSLKTFAFTVWVLAFVTAGLTYPGAFTDWGGFQLKTLIVPLIQIIMFGMGSTLSLSDFARVATMPRAAAALHRRAGGADGPRDALRNGMPSRLSPCPRCARPVFRHR